MLTIINAYNLIDGIDGLASIVAILALATYSAVFYLTENFLYVFISLTLNGSLLAFLSFNLSSSKKIFMGDTGSLILGFMIGILTLKFLTLSPDSCKKLPFLLENIPLIAFSILIIPLFDTARVFGIRIVNKKNPFSADRNHIHHILIDSFKLTHKKASFIIGAFNLVFVIITILLGGIFYNFSLIFFLGISLLIMTYLFYHFNYSFSNTKRKIIFKRKLEMLKNELRKNSQKIREKNN